MKTVKILDESCRMVATAAVAERDGCLAGKIDLSRTPGDLRRKFEQYEEIVNGQMFGLLDEIEEQIDALQLRAMRDGTPELPMEDLQVYPITGRVSFKFANGAAAPQSAA